MNELVNHLREYNLLSIIMAYWRILLLLFFIDKKIEIGMHGFVHPYNLTLPYLQSINNSSGETTDFTSKDTVLNPSQNYEIYLHKVLKNLL